ncbi:flippase [Undibacterium sp. CY18W]|uniref:Flippase n=1 Tax=Undibacterium hunanense TaxID=2762292 RepID=A0ABR6ZVM8_9BURK|nr:flippase [Undibacterium hunanense]MBC3919931.1 flippase [Undibacterium hunanense]
MSLKRNTIWNLLGNGLPLIAAAAFTPYTLRQLGNEAFGVLTLIWGLIGYFSLFDFGTGRALTYEISKLRSAGQFLAIPSVLKAGLLLTAATGMLGTLIMIVLAPHLAQNWLKISLPLQHDAQIAFEIAALGVIPSAITSGLRGAMEGLERFRASNLNKIFLGFCMFTLPALAIVLHGPRLWPIALYLAMARLLVVIGGALQLHKYLFTKTTNEPIRENGSQTSEANALSQRLRSLLSFGFWVTVSSIISPLMVFGDRFFVSAMVGADKLSVYAIPQEALMRMLLVPIAICGALLPLFATLADQQALKNSYRQNYRRMTFIMLGLCTAVALFAYPGFSLWLSPEFASKALPITLILAAGTFFNGIALVPHTLLHAQGQTKITAQFHFIELLLYIAVLYFLATWFGLAGAAFAWTFRVILDWILLHVTAQRHLKNQTAH